MANNRRPFSYDSRHQVLHIDNLKEGDKLIRVIRTGHQWGAPGTRREVEMTIKKVLKSRLVLTMPGRDGKLVDFRILVKNSRSWTYGNGEVSDKQEGQSEWSRDYFALYTPDDPFLIADREEFETTHADHLVKQAAVNALEAFKKSLTVDDAQAAIEKLQEYVARAGA